MDNKNTLNGFETIIDSLLPNVGLKKDNDDDNTDDIQVSESLTEEELEELKSKKTKKTKTKEEDDEPDTQDDIDDPDVLVEPKRTPAPDDDDTDNDEGDLIVGFFDSLSEKLGWDDVTDDEKPRTAEDLINYFSEVIQENSVPQYASDEVQKLDEFVRNGGRLRDYFEIDGELDLDNIKVEDNEMNQRLILKEFLKEKGYSTKQIDKKLDKYEDAGILEDEATDALEALRDIKTQKKELLLAQQQKSAREAEKQQQEFFQNVFNEIKNLNDIYGITVPEKDKKALLEYIFKPDSNGVTKYQKDYAKSLKNLITSAYFTMKGDSLIDFAKKKGKLDALDNFKNKLTKNTGVSKTSKRQIPSSDDGSIWDTFTRKFRVQ